MQPDIARLRAEVAGKVDQESQAVLWFTVWPWNDGSGTCYARPEVSEPIAIDRTDQWNAEVASERHRMRGPDVVIAENFL